MVYQHPPHCKALFEHLFNFSLCAETIVWTIGLSEQRDRAGRATMSAACDDGTSILQSNMLPCNTRMLQQRRSAELEHSLCSVPDPSFPPPQKKGGKGSALAWQQG